MYTVRSTPRAQRELDSVPQERLQAIVQALRSLEQNPRPPGTVKLWDTAYRIRIGQWRIIYHIDEARRRIEVGGVRRRSESTYHGVQDLFT